MPSISANARGVLACAIGNSYSSAVTAIYNNVLTSCGHKKRTGLRRLMVLYIKKIPHHKDAVSVLQVTRSCTGSSTVVRNRRSAAAFSLLNYCPCIYNIPFYPYKFNFFRFVSHDFSTLSTIFLSLADNPGYVPYSSCS